MRGLLRIVNDLLDRSAIAAGTLRIAKVPFIPLEVIQNATQPFEALAAGKGIQLLVDLDGSLASPRMGDPGRLNQMLTNLVGNAVKYTDAGRITVTASVNDEGKLICSVLDTGRGMDKVAQERLFTPYDRIEENGHRDPGGTGLGLYITAMLVQQMGGKIDVESAPGKGTRFTIQLPLAGIAENTLLRNVRPGSEHRSAGPVFFVVDDDQQERENSVVQLRKVHPEATIIEAGGGAEFLRILENTPGVSLDTAVVFTDLDMPRPSGFELVRILKDGPFSKIPCVAVTSSVLMLDPAELHALGFAAVLPKPLDAPRLAGLLREITADQAPYAALP